VRERILGKLDHGTNGRLFPYEYWICILRNRITETWICIRHPSLFPRPVLPAFKSDGFRLFRPESGPIPWISELIVQRVRRSCRFWTTPAEGLHHFHFLCLVDHVGSRFTKIRKRNVPGYSRLVLSRGSANYNLPSVI
jgi:hypothetical protein